MLTVVTFEMKFFIRILNFVAGLIAIAIFAGGIVTTGLAIYEFLHAFLFLTQEEKFNHGIITIRILQAIDLFIVALVFLIFSLGLYVLFMDKARPTLDELLPEWMRVKNFMQLKIVLWETILTTLVVSFLGTLAEMKLRGESLNPTNLILPGAIFLIALSLYFLKKEDTLHE